MKTLYLLRHAKSSWDDLSQRDIERPLNERGRGAAADMACYLAGNGPLPDLILCSPAVRTQETIERFLAAISADIPVVIEESLYNCGEAQILDCVRRAPDDCATLMIAGHYPAIPAFTVAMCDSESGPDREGLMRLAHKYPTAALAEIALPADQWSTATVGTGTLQRFIRPKNLVQSS